jgi:hypothetical protein
LVFLAFFNSLRGFFGLLQSLHISLEHAMIILCMEYYPQNKCIASQDYLEWLYASSCITEGDMVVWVLLIAFCLLRSCSHMTSLSNCSSGIF